MKNLIKPFIMALVLLLLFIGCREEKDGGIEATSNREPAVTTFPVSLDTPIIPVFETTTIPEPTVVPEPSTMLLLASGLLGLGGYGRKKFFKR